MILTCAVVGLGRIGSSLEKDSLREKPCTHTGAILSNPDCRLLAGADIDPEARRRYLEDWGERAGPEPLQVFTGADQLLAHVRPDILVASTPPENHLQIVSAAAEAGVPVVICEKPLAHSLADARRIARLHTNGRVKVLVNHERRYSADYRAVRELVDSGRYGRLISVNGTLYFGKSAAHRDVLLHDGTHLVDIINFLTRHTCRLRRGFGSMRAKTSSAYLFGTAGDIPVIIEVGAERDHLVFEVELSFEKGRVKVGNGVLRYEVSGESPYYENYRSLLPDEPPRIERTGYFSNMLEDAVRCVREPEYMPVSGAPDGLEVMKFIRSLRALF
jgi:predicted dehydrogenase